MKIKANDYIAQFLHAQGVKHVFEMAGGMITQLLDAIYKMGETQIVSVHHEQTASFAADAYGRCVKNVGVGLATSGPGATNLLTGIGSCYFDSSPALFITGQVNTHEQKGIKQIRQLGFQETDIVSMARAITKKCYQITSADEIESILKEAYLTAISDRPGPVLIDIPMNLQRAELDVEPIKRMVRRKIPFQPNTEQFDSLLTALKQAKRPLILAGGGIQSADVKEDFLRLVDILQVPIVTSLLGIDTIPFTHPLRAGFIGSYGNRWANIAIGNCDLLIVLGSRLDIRQTGADVESFSKNKKIFHVDCDTHEINNRLKNCVPMLMDLTDFISHLLSMLNNQKLSLKKDWLEEIIQLRKKWPDTAEITNVPGINPNAFMHSLARKSATAAGYAVDVGNHQMWAAQSLEVAENQFFITSGGMGAMGFALPAAIGASLAYNKKPVVVIAGDGSFQLNIQELQTVVRNKIPLKMIVINNQSLGMIRQFQDNYFDGRYQSTYWGYSAPNFAAVAMAYGISAKTINQSHEMEEAISWLWENDDKPCLLQVMVDMHANAYPKIAFGKPITEMEPFTSPTAMEGT